MSLARRLEGGVARRGGSGSGSPVRLSVVFVQWGGRTGRAAFAELDRRVSALEGVVVRRVVVDNAATTGGGGVDDQGHVEVIPGDNSAREFSGWMQGIAHVCAGTTTTDVWLLANDRFGAWRYPFLELLGGSALQLALARQAILGRIDYYPVPVRSFGLEVSSWVNTSLFVVPDGVLGRLGGPQRVALLELDKVLPGQYPAGPELFRPGGPVGADHARFLTGFLTHAKDAPHGAHWYRRLELSEETWPEFRAKVLSILNEQLFSAAAREAGVPILELGLADRLGAMGVDNPAVRDALDRLEREPEAERQRLCRTTSRIALATRALVHSTARPRRPDTAP